MAAFVDRVTVHVTAGNGAHGVSSVHREKFKPKRGYKVRYGARADLTRLEIGDIKNG